MCNRLLIPSGICGLLVQELNLSTIQLDAESGYISFFLGNGSEVSPQYNCGVKNEQGFP